MLLAVNFHYIGDEKYPFGGIYPVAIDAFRKQLAELGRYFKFVSLEDVHRALKGEQALPEKGCLITFDDGLRCQYELALPILRELDIPAGFFINGLPVFENKVCTVHKIHKLRSLMSQADFYELVDKALLSLYRQSILEFLGAKAEEASKKYRYDDVQSAQIKYLLNSILTETQKNEIVGKLFEKHFSEDKFCKDFYLSLTQIKDLSKRGWLGIHTYSHRPLSILTEHELNIEIGDFKIRLEKELGKNVFAISYPYGSTLDINQKVLNVCENIGLSFGLTMERAFNEDLKNPLVLARVDTNDAPGGKTL